MVRALRHPKDAHQSEERIRQAQKMQAVGQLAGGIAHDFNNLLGVILGYCELLGDQPALPEPARQMIAEINHASTSARKLTQGLLAFSRRQELQAVPLDLNEVVHRMQAMLARVIGDQVEFVTVPGEDLGAIKVDPGQVEQVLMNLAINARDAMPQGGKIRIETANVNIDAVYARQYPATSPGPFVMLTVSDEGTGMDQETRSHMFEPFFSTKAAGRGTGLGLSTVFAIVRQSGGAIAVHSVPGSGTTFRIYFPRCDQAPVAIQQHRATPLPRGTETILLVDDAIPLRALTKRILEDCGYTVLDAGNPAEALRIATDRPGPLPLMITDVVMPGFSGFDLAQRLAAFRPETRVLYASGCGGDSTNVLAARGQECAFLEKPFTRDDLLAKIRQLLDSPQPHSPPSAFLPASTPARSTRFQCG
jgi:two-component system cell cycle sensor histidine kinase/response regulator CckA